VQCHQLRTDQRLQPFVSQRLVLFTVVSGFAPSLRRGGPNQNKQKKAREAWEPAGPWVFDDVDSVGQLLGRHERGRATGAAVPWGCAQQQQQQHGWDMTWLTRVWSQPPPHGSSSQRVIAGVCAGVGTRRAWRRNGSGSPSGKAPESRAGYFGCSCGGRLYGNYSGLSQSYKKEGSSLTCWLRLASWLRHATETSCVRSRKEFTQGRIAQDTQRKGRFLRNNTSIDLMKGVVLDRYRSNFLVCGARSSDAVRLTQYFRTVSSRIRWYGTCCLHVVTCSGPFAAAASLSVLNSLR
jgi:hypothetical protein